MEPQTMTEPAKLSTSYTLDEIREVAEAGSYDETGILTAMLKQLLAEVDELRDKLRPRSWIPVSERLPVHQNFYLAVVGNDGAPARVKYLFYREEDRSFIDHHNVTHWMELPKLPDTEQEGS